MAKQPIINGKVVERAYEDYRSELFLVNRRYQRKLVWGVDEKRAFIDSLANGYPVPLFLFAKNDYKDLERFEIIDGLQRLNAVFSFIENGYAFENGCFFDLASTAITKDLLDKGIVQQKLPILERSICVKIVSYELPFSIYDEKDSGQMVGSRLYRGPRYFQLLFLALHNLLVKKEKKIEDYDLVYNKLSNISNVTMNIAGGGGWWASKEKNELIQATSAVLAPCLVDRNMDDPMYYSYATELETLLNQSKTENSQYDFKQGLFDLKTEILNEELINKIFKTLTAMANTDNKAVGYVIIGVADKFEDAEKIKNKYGEDYVRRGTFYINGVDGEVKKYYGGNYDKYFSMIKNKLQNAPITEHYRRQLGAKIRMVNYYNKSVIILKLTSDNGAVMYDNAYYTRIGANNDPVAVSAEEMPAFFAKFVK